MKKKNIYILGNPLVELDRKAVILFDFLQRFFSRCHFIHLDPTEEIEEIEEKTFCCIDAVIGIEKVTVFESLKDFVRSPRFSAHDYDLLVQLRLLQKLGKITSFTIIGVPHKGKKKIIQRDVAQVLSAMSSTTL